VADNARALKLAGTIKKIVAGALETEIKDPRLGFITVTDVRVTGDLQQASVFYTVLGSDEDRTNTAAALESAKGRLRSLVGSQLGIRLTPSLEFHLDAVPETAASLDRALHEARERDAELARLRENAQFAGDEDPYRRPEEDA
jgi:ribosome-binding factor A